jgi:hypothetical protein
MSAQYTTVSFSVSNGVQFLQQVASGFTSIGVNATMSGNNLTFPSMGNAQFIGSTASLQIQNPYSGKTYNIPASGSVTLFARKDASGNPTVVSVSTSGGYTVGVLKSGSTYFTVDPNGDIFDLSGNGWYYFAQPSIFQTPNFLVGSNVLLLPVAVFRGSSGQILDGIFFTSQYINNIGTSINANAQICNVSGTFYVFGRFAYQSPTGTILNASAAVRDA